MGESGATAHFGKLARFGPAALDGGGDPRAQERPCAPKGRILRHVMHRRNLLALMTLCAVACTSDDDGSDGTTADATPPGGPDAAPPGTPDAMPQSFACAPTTQPGHQEIACPDGVAMDVELSAACAAGGCGLIVDVHGLTMSADQLDTHTRMRTLAPPLGYVVVQPTAPGSPATWGTGEHDDVVWDFVLATLATLDIDADRVHFMGFSQGSMMTFRMLCAHADVIASVAPDSGGGCFGGTPPSAERSILYVQGTMDNILPWSQHGPPQRDAILGTWDFGAPQSISSATKYTASRYTTSAGTVFEFWQHDYVTADGILGGHCLAVPDGSGFYKCPGAEFDYSAEALRFFMAHPRP
jgi:pimeloyl-ACP methyl ester carboxylesterase